MVRGIVPRQPAKTGRHEGMRALPKSAAVTRPASQRVPKPSAKKTQPTKPARTKCSLKRYNPVAPERVQAILGHLTQMYQDVVCALHHRNAWELLVATILSAQSTDANVNRVTPKLFEKYPTVQHFAALQPEELEPDVRSTGFFRNKSKSVVGAAKKIVADFGGEVPSEMEKLLTLPGVARKTANVLLGSWFKRNDGVVVDTHVHRISRRWEFTKNSDPQKIEQDLMKIIPQPRWTLFSHQVIHHGRSLCIARKPKCSECPIEPLCHAEDKTWSTVEMHKGAKA